MHGTTAKISFRQGQLVHFKKPNWVAPEMSKGRAVVLCSDQNNAISTQILICPLTETGSPVAVGFTSLRGQALFLHPDRMEEVSTDWLTPVPRLNSDQPIILPPSIVESAIKKLVEWIAPTQKKLAERPQSGMPAYGEIVYFSTVPHRSGNGFGKNVPVLCLTPSDAKTNGMILGTRLYSNMSRYDDVYCVGLHCNGRPGFITNNLQPLSSARLLPKRHRDREIVSLATLEAFIKRLWGNFSQEAHLELIAKYGPCRPGMAGSTIEGVISPSP